MKEQIQVLKQTELCGRQFSVYGTPDNPLFKAKDIAEIIQHSQVVRMLQNVDEDEKEVNIIHTPGGKQEMWFVTEDGLYEILMQSRKPIAKQFKKGVKTILKEIRRTGGYIATTANDSPEDIMARALVVAQETLRRKEREIANAVETAKMSQKVAEIALQARDKALAKVEADKAKVLFAECVSASPSSILIGQMAKLITQNGYKIGQNRLFAWLRDNDYLCSRGESYNQPTQRAMDKGLFEIKKTEVTAADGTIIVRNTTKVTGKGQIYFINKFANTVNV